MFSLNYLGKRLTYQDEAYREFNRYHDQRFNITDKTTPDFEVIEDDYKALGLDYVDYVMLNSWNFDDRDVYPDKLLVKVADLQLKALKADPVTPGDVISLLFARGAFYIPVSFTLYIPALLALALDRKRFYSLVLVAASYAMLAVFVFYGRSEFRAEWGVYFGAASCLAAGFNYDPWIRPEQGLFCEHYAYFGGCTMRHPGEIYAL